jgi:hypothetical protein
LTAIIKVESHLSGAAAADRFKAEGVEIPFP